MSQILVLGRESVRVSSREGFAEGSECFGAGRLCGPSCVFCSAFACSRCNALGAFVGALRGRDGVFGHGTVKHGGEDGEGVVCCLGESPPVVCDPLVEVRDECVHCPAVWGDVSTLEEVAKVSDVAR